MSNAYISNYTSAQIETLFNLYNKILTKTEAAEIYLTQADAANTYLTKNAANTTYLTQTDAASTYLTQNDADDTYLTKTDAASTYLTQTDAASTYLTQTDAASTFATKSQVNSLICTPGTTYTTLTSGVTANSSSWGNIITNWTAPSNGYLNIYLGGASNTPSVYILDNTSGLQYRGNGNGSRDFGAILPVVAGHSYTAACVYSKPTWVRFYPAMTIS